MRPACPPLVHGCRFLNFSQSKSELDLAARRAVKAFEGDASARLDDYADPSTDRYQAMVELRSGATWASPPFSTRDWTTWSPRSGCRASSSARTAGTESRADDA